MFFFDTTDFLIFIDNFYFIDDILNWLFLVIQNKIRKLSGCVRVDDADIWDGNLTKDLNKHITQITYNELKVDQSEWGDPTGRFYHNYSNPQKREKSDAGCLVMAIFRVYL